MLMRYKSKIIGSAAQCTRCKFPLVGADYSDDTLTWCVVCVCFSSRSVARHDCGCRSNHADCALTYPACLCDISCRKIDSKVCGTGYKLPNGEVVESKGTLLSGLFSKTAATRLPVFATLVQGGKVKMGVAPPAESE